MPSVGMTVIVMLAVVSGVVVAVLRAPRRPPVLAKKRHKDQPEHVERRHPRRQNRQTPEQLVVKERAIENFVLTEKTGKRWHSGDGDRADEHGNEGNGHIEFHPAHLLHVLLVVHRMDDGATTEKQQRFKESVGHQVKRRGRKRTYASRQKHVAELRNSRVRQNLFDVGLNQSDRSRHQGRHHPDRRYGRHDHRRLRKQHRVPTDHVDTSRNHRRSVNQR